MKKLKLGFGDSDIKKRRYKSGKIRIKIKAVLNEMEEELIKIQPIHKEVPQIFEYFVEINEKLDSILDEK